MVYISEKDCHSVMDEALKGRSFDIVDFVVQPFSEVMGFHGSHALLKITAKVGGKVKDYTFFVKFATKNQVVFDRYFGRMKMFFKEHIIITKLMAEMQAQVGKRLTSDCYLSRLNKFMVLENLNDINYEVIRRKEGLDFAHAKIAVQTFADFHAASLLMEENGRYIKDVYPEVCFESFFSIPPGEKSDECLILSCKKGASAWTQKIMPEISSNIREKTFNMLTKCVMEYSKTSKKYKNVMCHGDPWGNNVMYKYDGERPVEGILVDFQASRFAPPAVDLMHFLYVATDKELREKHSSELEELYYTRLGDTLESRGADIDKVYPREEFVETCSIFREFGICIRLYYNYITRIPGKYLAPAVTDVEVFLGLMIGGDPTIPLAAAEDEKYREDLIESIRESVQLYTSHK